MKSKISTILVELMVLGMFFSFATTVNVLLQENDTPLSEANYYVSDPLKNNILQTELPFEH